jgi:hypothetical protein
MKLSERARYYELLAIEEFKNVSAAIAKAPVEEGIGPLLKKQQALFSFLLRLSELRRLLEDREIRNPADAAQFRYPQLLGSFWLALLWDASETEEFAQLFMAGVFELKTIISWVHCSRRPLWESGDMMKFAEKKGMKDLPVPDGKVRPFLNEGALRRLAALSPEKAAFWMLTLFFTN